MSASSEPVAPRVLHLNTEPTWRGGEQQVLYLMNGLAERGVTQAIVAQPGGPMAERARERGHEVIERRMRGEVDLPAVFALGRAIQAGGYNLVHAHTSHAHTLGALAVRLAGGKPRPKMIVARRVDFSIFRRSFFGLNGLKYKHGVDQYITVSEAIRQVLIKDGLDPGSIECVHSGIELRKILDAPERTAELRAELEIPDGHAFVGNVAHMADHKGQRYLIEAAPKVLAEHPEVTFAIVGDGELRADLLAQAEELGVSGSFRFPGFRRDVPSLLKAMDIFVMPSHMEGLGTSVLDALTAGLPVVGTEAGGMPEILLHEETGLVAPIRDADAIATHLLRLLREPELAKRLAEAGAKRVAEHFSTTSMVEGTLRVYRRLLGLDPDQAPQ
ncbi:MAG TPA: glycosyl transferase [Planctomycetes bacterium]|nr:glycosyl transferase [Planctomycetota bacterium]